MKLKTFFGYLFLLNIAIYSQDKIGFDVDIAKFNYDQNSVYLELYYSFAQNTLETRENDSQNYISSDLHIQLSDKNDSSYIDETYTLKTPVDLNSEDYNNKDLIGVLGFQVPNGSYALSVSVKDNYSEKAVQKYSESIDLNSMSDSKLSFSDIELCSKIIQDGADPNSIYYKNSLEIIPNPKNVYGVNLPVLYYYSELYNNSDSERSDLKLKRVIKQNDGIYDLFEEKLNLSSGAIVKVGLINLSDFVSGRYTLLMSVLDSDNNVLTNTSKDFFVYNPQNTIASDLSDPQKNYIRSEFGIMSEEECDYTFDVSKFIAAEAEKELYESLVELDAKRKFLFEFWEKRDLEPETPLNEFHQKYMSRVNYVNENYGHRHKKGYKTDRGRVALVYGLPDQIDTQTNDAELKPYEIWRYNSIEGGIIFVFGDTMGISELELLHSDKRGEIADRNWQRRLTIKGGFR